MDGVNEKEGCYIDPFLFNDENLTFIEMILLKKIDYLDNSDRGCYAANETLGLKIRKTGGTTANMISKLKKKGYIIQLWFDGRQRGLRVPSLKSESSSHKKVKTSRKDESRLHSEVEQPSLINEHKDKKKDKNENRERETPPPPHEKQLPKHMIATDCLLQYLKKNEDMRNTLRQLSGFKGTDKQMAQEAKDFCSYYYDSGPLLNKIIKNPTQGIGKFQNWLRKSREFSKNNNTTNHKLLN